VSTALHPGLIRSDLTRYMMMGPFTPVYNVNFSSCSLDYRLVLMAFSVST
jgi:hypothetical protein